MNLPLQKVSVAWKKDQKTGFLRKIGFSAQKHIQPFKEELFLMTRFPEIRTLYADFLRIEDGFLALLLLAFV